ncbi:hypothetical protein H9Y04_10770 [Streptomyces sp. TRM66268-LWL]|uniref:ATP-binding protein n=1 Tax=Streptomyces polyasparticus TaxID=2767826 RepID=A0ABR7SF18_9ACTN|nr:hypothetical protein [Streptomyces polyasparticus]MBC9713051.1 hypothetical protein [Streptomyces polyasparticus]
MTEPSVVERLYFGHDEAEQDMANGLLRAGFLQTAAYDAAVSGRKMLIIGRKGSGKSAICVHLGAEGGHAGATVTITPDDAAGDEIRRFELQGLAGDTAKSLMWRYVFALHAARHLTEHARKTHGRREPDAVKDLRKFLRDNGELPGTRLADFAAQGRERLQTNGLQLGAFGFQIGVDLGHAVTEGARAVRQLEVLEDHVALAFRELDCARTHPPLLLLVDQLEKVWSGEADANSMVIGLLLAAKDVAVKYPGAVRCLVFLRSDIYDSLTFGEGDKFRSYEMRIDWPVPQLRRLALSRAQASVGPGLGETDLWQGVFPRRVEGEETASYLFTRTLPRPRDAIQYLNLCRDRAVHNGRTQITESDVMEAGRQFSVWKLQDLAQEYLVAHPFLDSLLGLFGNGGYVVTRASLGSLLAQARGDLERRFPAYSESFTPEAVIDILYTVGFLGVRRGDEVVYAGGFDRPLQADEKEFQIHPCFREALRTQDAVPLTPYSPALRVRPLNSGFTPPRRDFDLLRAVAAACDRLLRLIARASGLPSETRHDLVQHLQRLRHETADALDDPTGPSGAPLQDAEGHVAGAVAHLRVWSTALQECGLEDQAQELGAQAVARELTIQATGLNARLGGLSGGTGEAGSSA